MVSMSCRKQQASRTTSYQSITIGPPNKMLSRTDPGQGVSKIKEEIPTMTLMTIMVLWISFTVSDQAILLQSACRRYTSQQPRLLADISDSAVVVFDSTQIASTSIRARVILGILTPSPMHDAASLPQIPDHGKKQGRFPAADGTDHAWNTKRH